VSSAESRRLSLPWRWLLPLGVLVGVGLLPVPEGLPAHAWLYFAVFTSVVNYSTNAQQTELVFRLDDQILEPQTPQHSAGPPTAIRQRLVQSQRDQPALRTFATCFAR